MENFDYTINPQEVINLRAMNAPPPPREPKIDKLVSEKVGKDIKVTDSKLIKLVTKWKQEENKGDESKINSNYLEDPEKVKELKEVFV